MGEIQEWKSGRVRREMRLLSRAPIFSSLSHKPSQNPNQNQLLKNNLFLLIHSLKSISPTNRAILNLNPNFIQNCNFKFLVLQLLKIRSSNRKNTKRSQGKAKAPLTPTNNPVVIKPAPTIPNPPLQLPQTQPRSNILLPKFSIQFGQIMRFWPSTR